MRLFTYKNPYYRGSTKSIEILDEEQNRVGYLQRKHRGFFQKTIDFVMNSSFIIDVYTYGFKNDLYCEISEQVDKQSLFKSIWKGNSNNLGNFMLFDKTKITTHPRMELHTDQGDKYRIEKDFAVNSVFIVNESDRVIAEISYDNPIPPQLIAIQQKSSDLHVLDIAALYYLLNIKY